jgi:hypothetical protein
VRPLRAVLALLAFTFAAASGCGSNASSSNDAGSSTGQYDAGSSTGASCKSDLDCEGGSCVDGVCQGCPFTYSQCMCGDTPVGPLGQFACVVGQGCGSDAGLADGGDGDGGVCQCVAITLIQPCT